MKTSMELRTMLRSIDHKGYPAYKSLAGYYQFEKYILSIDHVQGDPFAAPSSLHVEVPLAAAGFPADFYREDCTRIALQDFLTRCMQKQFNSFNFKAKGSGKSGLISISYCGQEILERSACEMTAGQLIFRFHVGFPAFGRTIQAKELERILFEFLPKCIENAAFYQQLDRRKVKAVIELAQDQAAIRRILQEKGWVAFVADGAILPRKSGVSDLPMDGSIQFEAPETMAAVLNLPHHGAIRGMAVPKGVTLIVGGGYHGKSTLLEALQNGVYNHIAGDGREFVITDETAVKLRAEDGRSIRNVDISMFINDLPNKKNTKQFSTEDASGSTSQAAGVVESIEAGSRLFLIDEDTSATNFMVRDALMQQVINREKEPITPFIERMRALYEQAGISTILVAGSSGAFFYVADRVLQMDNCHAVDITGKVRNLCKNYPKDQIEEEGLVLPSSERIFCSVSSPDTSGTDRKYGNLGRSRSHEKQRDHMKIKVSGTDGFSLDRENVDVRYVEQLADSEQTNALAYLLRYGLEQKKTGQTTVREMAEGLNKCLKQNGWAPFCGAYIPCGLAKPRIQEIYSVLNCYRDRG
jgi:predicted ABC-class ATPase